MACPIGLVCWAQGLSFCGGAIAAWQALRASQLLGMIKTLEAHAWTRYPEIRCTVSFGVTDHGLNGSREPYAWVEAADRALYAAKHGGRNRVERYSESIDESLRRAS